jgi:disulfide bond formation protein DsbB
MQEFFNVGFSAGTIALQIFLIATLISWRTKGSLIRFVASNLGLLLRVIFVGAAIGSLIYQYVLLYPPCLLCWYQRIAIFSTAIILCTADIRRSVLLRMQVVILSSLGLIIALFHNIIDIFPTGIDACGANGPSCLARYVYEFGYITIPMMSATILLTGIVFPLITRRYPHISPIQA